MKKVRKTVYRGIEFVRLSHLPAAQAAALQEVLTPRTLVKIIRADGKLLTDCVLYSAYEAWYARQAGEKAEPATADPAFSRQVRLA